MDSQQISSQTFKTEIRGFWVPLKFRNSPNDKKFVRGLRNTCLYFIFEFLQYPSVGKYSVLVDDFERIAIPAVDAGNCAVVIIDEIGKMELFSRRFANAVEEIFVHGNCSVVATIPIAKGKPLPLVERIRSRSDVKLFEVTKANRNSLLEEIYDFVVKNRQSEK